MQFFLTISTIISLIWGCRTNSIEVSDRDQAIELLNQSEYEKAIVILEKILKEHPESNEAKLLLASAYSGSAGVNMVDMFPLFSSAVFRERRSLSGQAIVESEKEDETTEQNAFTKVEKKHIRFIDTVADGFTIFMALPYSQPEQRGRLKESTILISEIDEDSDFYRRGKYLSALVNISLFFNYLKDSFDRVNFAEKPSWLDLICSFSPEKFAKNSKISMLHFRAAIADITYIRQYDSQELTNRFIKFDKAAQAIISFYTDNIDAITIGDIVHKNLVNSHCE